MRRVSLLAELAAWSLASVCASTLLYDGAEALRAQRAVQQIVLQSSNARPARLALAGFSPTSKVKPIGNPDQVLGKLDIPALHLSTPIVNNDDDESLMMGAGHVRGTAMPGGLGNFAVAAHRDTYFRPLAGIRPGMKMDVVTADGTYTYIVASTKIVSPEDVEVLDMGDIPEMTLITCYPFHYIGSAPKRFVVRGRLQGF